MDAFLGKRRGTELRDLGHRVRERFTDEDVSYLYGIMERVRKTGSPPVRGARRVRL